MPRRREVQKRKILPDPKFQDRLVTKFINNLMRKGKRSTAEQICYGALEIVQDKGKDEALKLFKKALENIKPVVEVKSSPRRWRDLPGARRGPPGPPRGAGHALAHQLRQGSRREDHAREAGGRDPRCFQQPRQR